MLRYAISNLSALAPGDKVDLPGIRRARWLRDLTRWAEEEVDFVQLREKELEAGEIFSLAVEGMRLLHRIFVPERSPGRPQLLVNGRPDVAAAAHADGVHLTSRPGELTTAQVRAVYRAAGLPRCLVSVSCHSLSEVSSARASGADLILFGPVFEKRVAGEVLHHGVGLEALRRASDLAGPVAVLGLGGISSDRAPLCLEMGAAGIAGIRLFA